MSIAPNFDATSSRPARRDEHPQTTHEIDGVPGPTTARGSPARSRGRRPSTALS